MARAEIYSYQAAMQPGPDKGIYSGGIKRADVGELLRNLDENASNFGYQFFVGSTKVRMEYADSWYTNFQIKDPTLAYITGKPGEYGIKLLAHLTYFLIETPIAIFTGTPPVVAAVKNAPNSEEQLLAVGKGVELAGQAAGLGLMVYGGAAAASPPTGTSISVNMTLNGSRTAGLALAGETVVIPTAAGIAENLPLTGVGIMMAGGPTPTGEGSATSTNPFGSKEKVDKWVEEKLRANGMDPDVSGEVLGSWADRTFKNVIEEAHGLVAQGDFAAAAQKCFEAGILYKEAAIRVSKTSLDMAKDYAAAAWSHLEFAAAAYRSGEGMEYNVAIAFREAARARLVLAEIYKGNAELGSLAGYSESKALVNFRNSLGKLDSVAVRKNVPGEELAGVRAEVVEAIGELEGRGVGRATN